MTDESIKELDEEEISDLEKKLFTGNGELRDLLPLAGISCNSIDHETRAYLFWEEIKFLNDEIEKLGGKKREYIPTEKQKKKSEELVKQVKKFEEENKEKIEKIVRSLVNQKIPV